MEADHRCKGGQKLMIQVGGNRTSSLSSWLQRVGDLSVAVGLGSWSGWVVYVSGGDMA